MTNINSVGIPNPEFHFPTNIHLDTNPLVEAWLEIRWKLSPDSSGQFEQDKDFPFALGVFYNDIKKDYSYREPLPQSFAPEELLPYVVRYRFRKEPNSWPMLQLGPGVASINFTSPYSWEEFKEQALYLRDKLINAYSGSLTISNLILRYRNALEHNYISADLLAFLENKLNTSITTPTHIPGTTAKTTWPSELNIALTYDLLEPLGKGAIRFSTGRQRSKNSEKPVLIFETSVHSLNEKNNCWATQDDFDSWLMAAHAITHEWFFALIDGDLRQEYEKGT